MPQHSFDIPCDDIEKSVRFYRDFLGLELLSLGQHSARLAMGSTILNLVEKKDDPPPTTRLSMEVGSNELDVYYRELLRRYAEIVQHPTDRGHGCRTLYFKDPHGNTVQMYAYLSL